MKKLAFSIIGIGGIIAFLLLAKTILIPFVYGVVLWFLSRYLKDLLLRIPFLKSRLPNWLTNTFVFATVFLALFMISGLVTKNIGSLLENSSTYRANFDELLQLLNSTF
ncbi:MAG: hypothetical protein AAF789_13995, partial [Bacteroidota bacterium]